MKIILDTNVFVSAALGGRTAPILAAWRHDAFTLIVSENILREYSVVLRRPRLALPAAHVDALIEYAFRVAEFVTPCEAITAVADDPSDDMFLEAAVAGSVDLIVSGDRHLLHLGHFRHIPIITTREFLVRLERHD